MEGVNPNKLVQKWRDFETGVKDRCPLARYNSNSSWRTNEGWRKRRLSSQHSQLTRYTSSHDAYPMIIQQTRIRFALIKVLFLRLLSFATFRFLLSYTLSWNFSLGRLIILKLSEPISRPSFDKVISCQVNYFTRMIQVIESQALGSNRQTPARPGPSDPLCSARAHLVRPPDFVRAAPSPLPLFSSAVRDRGSTAPQQVHVLFCAARPRLPFFPSRPLLENRQRRRRRRRQRQQQQQQFGQDYF